MVGNVLTVSSAATSKLIPLVDHYWVNMRRVITRPTRAGAVGVSLRNPESFFAKGFNWWGIGKGLYMTHETGDPNHLVGPVIGNLPLGKASGWSTNASDRYNTFNGFMFDNVVEKSNKPRE